MIAVHAHLILNHAPLVALIIGLVFAVAGSMRRSPESFLTGLRIFVAVGAVSVPVAISGLVASRALAGVDWLDPQAVDTHQWAGLACLASILALAILAGVGLRKARRSPGGMPVRLRRAILGLAVATLALLLWVAKLGGALRHTEVALSVRQDGVRSAQLAAESRYDACTRERGKVAPIPRGRRNDP